MQSVVTEDRAIDKDLVRAVIEKDQLVAGALVERGPYDWTKGQFITCENPAHCAVGALLFQAGIANEQLRVMPSVPEDMDDEDLALLYNTYGLNVEALDVLMTTNDGSTDLGRKQAVLAAVERLQDGAFETGAEFLERRDREYWGSKD